MPTDDHAADSAQSAALPPVTRQRALTRRSMLRTTAGAGAVGLVAGATLSAAVPALAAARQAAPASTGHADAAAGHADAAAGHADAAAGHSDAVAEQVPAGPVVVYVRDVPSGDLEIFAGASHARLRDPALAARLARAIRPAQVS